MKLCVIACGVLIACQSAKKTNGNSSTGGQASSTIQTKRVDITAVDTHFTTRDHFMASVEMQISGEPLAEAMGRDLTGYSRDAVPSDQYFDPAKNGQSRIDLVGFSSGVESYEYSKQPMNNLAFESGAGTSLAFGPVLNATALTGTDALNNLRDWVQKIAPQSNAVSRFVYTAAGAPPGLQAGAVTAPPLGDAKNPTGWPGFWPTLDPFTAFDPSIAPTNAVDRICSISSDDDPAGSGSSLLSNDYECDYTSLNLPNRDAQVSKTISPGATGWASWKDMLWVLNYLQVMHDSTEAGMALVAEADLSCSAAQTSCVGSPDNTIIADDGSGSKGFGSGVKGAAGTFLGSSDIEGFQAAMFISIVDNQAAEWLGQLTTTDGSMLGGFASTLAALNYSNADPLCWLAGEVSVSEDETDASGFPRPNGFTIKSADSTLLDLAGMLGATSSLYSLTDQQNTDVGGSQPALVYFDGDPFPADNQLPDGEATPHDRALALMRVLLVNIDRAHFTNGQFADTATSSGGTLTAGSVLSADTAAYALLALRTARRALVSTLQLYSNNTPDAQGAPTPLDTLPAVFGDPQSVRLDKMINALADIFYSKLSTADGHAYLGYDFAKSVPNGDGNDLDAVTAAIRGNWLAYLSTGDTKYRDRAEALFGNLDASFYDPTARIYHLRAKDDATSIVFTPRRFGLLQAALRDTYELHAVQPGNDTEATLIQDRLARLNKLVLNGWDDRDQDEQVTWPDECARVVGGLPRGGLQMAERTLTGETGTQADNLQVTRVVTTDREHDCVPEISAAGLPAALADSVTFSIKAQ